MTEQLSQTAPLVLVTINDKTRRRTVLNCLKDGGYRTIEASDGELCLTAWRKRRPAMLVLDMDLPDQSGLDICAAIRSEKNCARQDVSRRGPNQCQG